MQPPLARALIAELIGTFALVFAGAGAVIGTSLGALAYQFVRDEQVEPGEIHESHIEEA